MHELRIAENLIRLRHKRKITQEELADYIGVTKGSVSKWEKNISKPDLQTIPVLATFFGVTIDELLGYLPQLSKDEIQKLYLDYSNSFAVSDFDKTVEDIRTTVKHYYSCYPLVFQMCVLLLNHYLLAKTQKLQTELLHYMKDLCDHIIAHCADLNLCKDTLILKALILMGGGQYKEALQILEADSDPRTLSRESDSVLVSAYLMNGDREKACDFAQITMYLNLFSLVELSAKYLTVAASDQNAFDMTVERVESLIDSYQLVKLNANAVSVFEYQAALGYLQFDDPDAALTHTRKYLDGIRTLLSDEEYRLHGDRYFNRIDHWIEQLANGSVSPRARKTFVKDIAASLSHPLFEKLKDDNTFRRLQNQLKEMIE